MAKLLCTASRRVAVGFLVCGALASALVLTTSAQDDGAIDFTQPMRHFRVPNPAQLSDVDALSVYDRIRDGMVAAYRLSRKRIAGRYYKWKRYNRAPYRSATHGDRYINNYANAEAAPHYGRSEAGPMPPRAALAKDSFTVTAQGDVFTGPLFLMEKMPPGFSEETRDWRYTMIVPDGSLLGTTGGELASAWRSARPATEPLAPVAMTCFSPQRSSGCAFLPRSTPSDDERPDPTNFNRAGRADRPSAASPCPGA